MADRNHTRDRIVETASRLFLLQGYHATGLSQIVKESKAPKGSLYHFFPEGKEQLAMECISLSKRAVLDSLRSCMESEPSVSKALQAFVRGITESAGSFAECIPFSFWMFVETSGISDDLRQACQTVFSEWQGSLEAALQQGGLDPESAGKSAILIISMLEGAVILAMTNNDTRPFRLVEEFMPVLVNGTHGGVGN
ncbi:MULTISPECIES: TetR/AcrR family transcriptional regulator [unclassified Paenibacillus]|uniref:TetR/AcrR family transcriptional regulator n=1 Tax=unclassified Paenibacillus TaxID=185978 RepID=UPI00095639B4|nr:MULTISPECIES: TetR/AcrR family transcriptional regulator [unclassified Paenibacillus]ASS66873.1 TetR/AcrR family transcriptional regulator [Paenibacillus sp. RUD330]SIR71686.1 transcriptional regulator, TetR family [Paenibacillus sp. RU4X]SIR79060.1 transcriptional regulator, TetR family [Paenibacillus sp. RU4T]